MRYFKIFIFILIPCEIRITKITIIEQSIKVVYHQFYTLLDDGNLGDTDFTGNYDLNFNIFNLDFVYSWEFAPGSYLNVIWKNNIFQADDIRYDDYFDNLNKTFNAPQSNGLSLKVIYYLDYQYLHKNKQS